MISTTPKPGDRRGNDWICDTCPRWTGQHCLMECVDPQPDPRLMRIGYALVAASADLLDKGGE
jgi:hypothetical protein